MANVKLSERFELVAGALREADKLPSRVDPAKVAVTFEGLKTDILRDYIPTLLNIASDTVANSATHNRFEIALPNANISIAEIDWIRAYLYSALITLGKLMDHEDDNQRLATLLVHVAAIYGIKAEDLDAHVEPYRHLDSDLATALLDEFKIDEYDIVKTIGNYYRYNTDIDLDFNIRKLAVWLTVYGGIKFDKIPLNLNLIGVNDHELLSSTANPDTD